MIVYGGSSCNEITSWDSKPGWWDYYLTSDASSPDLINISVKTLMPLVEAIKFDWCFQFFSSTVAKWLAWMIDSSSARQWLPVKLSPALDWLCWLMPLGYQRKAPPCQSEHRDKTCVPLLRHSHQISYDNPDEYLGNKEKLSQVSSLHHLIHCDTIACWIEFKPTSNSSLLSNMVAKSMESSPDQNNNRRPSFYHRFCNNMSMA